MKSILKNVAVLQEEAGVPRAKDSGVGCEWKFFLENSASNYCCAALNTNNPKQLRHHLPNDDNDEIQHVPAVPHVRVLVHHQTVGNNLQKGLDCENDEEGILNCFLGTHT